MSLQIRFWCFHHLLLDDEGIEDFAVRKKWCIRCMIGFADQIGNLIFANLTKEYHDKTYELKTSIYDPILSSIVNITICNNDRNSISPFLPDWPGSVVNVLSNLISFSSDPACFLYLFVRRDTSSSPRNIFPSNYSKFWCFPDLCSIYGDRKIVEGETICRFHGAC